MHPITMNIWNMKSANNVFVGCFIFPKTQPFQGLCIPGFRWDHAAKDFIPTNKYYNNSFFYTKTYIGQFDIKNWNFSQNIYCTLKSIQAGVPTKEVFIDLHHWNIYYKCFVHSNKNIPLIVIGS